MAKTCRVKVTFEVQLYTEPLKEVSQSVEDDKKQSVAMKALFEKIPGLVDCSDVRIVECVEEV